MNGFKNHSVETVTRGKSEVKRESRDLCKKEKRAQKVKSELKKKHFRTSPGVKFREFLLTTQKLDQQETMIETEKTISKNQPKKI